MKNIIEVENLKKSFGSVDAVNGISFEVEEGSFFAFLGPNGAGKSTTIEVLCTFSRADSGKILINGYEVGKDNMNIRENIGVVFQNNVLDDLLTVQENLELRAGLYNKNKDSLDTLIQEAMETTDIVDLKDRPYGKLSGGQRRRADLARGLIHRPKVLYLDEPTTGLDPQTRQQVWKTIKEMQRQNNLTIFLTTHYMDEAAQADKIIILDHGKIEEEGSPNDLKEKYAKNKLIIISKNKEFQNILKKDKINFQQREDQFIVHIDKTTEAIPLSSKYQDYIESYEVLKGSMDDVFLNITGKELK